MTSLVYLSALVLALSLGLGFIRIFSGPSIEDRMMSVQLVGTTGLGLLLLFGPLLGMASSVDVTLVLALLAAVSVDALTVREGNSERGGG